MLSLAMFIGMFTGSQLIGPISDSYGRRTGTIFAMTLTSVFGFLSVLSPSLGVLLVTRFCVGISAPADPIIGHPIIGSGENENYRVKRVSRPDFSTRYNGHLTVI